MIIITVYRTTSKLEDAQLLQHAGHIAGSILSCNELLDTVMYQQHSVATN